jgi:hypothetical protein
MKRRKRSLAEKQYWKIINSIEKARFLLENFYSSHPDMEEEPREELAQAGNELDDLAYRLCSLRFELQEAGLFEEEPDFRETLEDP